MASRTTAPPGPLLVGSLDLIWVLSAMANDRRGHTVVLTCMLSHRGRHEVKGQGIRVSIRFALATLVAFHASKILFLILS